MFGKGKVYTDVALLVGKLNVDKLKPINQEKEVNPDIEQVIVLPDTGYTGLSKVTVNAVSSDIDDNIVSSNIKEGVEILGVVGTYEQGYFTSYENNTLVFDNSDRPISVNESELILE